MRVVANQLQAQVERLVSAVAELSPRARRATALMAVAIIGIAATSVYYLRPWVVRPAVVPVATYIPPSPQPGSTGREVQYEVVSAALVWAVMIDSNGYDGPGHYWLFRTVDGGRTWSMQAKGKTADVWSTAMSLRFVDRRTAFFAGGDPLTLHKTADGGQNWRTLALPVGSFQSIQFIDSIHGWLVGGGQRLYSTHDGGTNWIQFPDTPPDLAPLPAFRDESEGWAGSSEGRTPHIYSTSDGGRTWQSHRLPTPTDLPPDLNFSTWVRLVPGEGLLVSMYGGTDSGPVVNLAFETMDGGATWIPLQGPTSDSAGAVSAFQDSMNWWTLFGPDLYKSSDAGLSWTHFDAVAPANMELIRVLDARHAWGVIYDEAQSFDLGFTADGGMHWTRVKAPSDKLTTA